MDNFVNLHKHRQYCDVDDLLEAHLVILEVVNVPDHDSPDGSVVGLEQGAGRGFGDVLRGAVLVGHQNAQVPHHARGHVGHGDS